MLSRVGLFEKTYVSEVRTASIIRVINDRPDDEGSTQL
jgi:hypothetical protein